MPKPANLSTCLPIPPLKARELLSLVRVARLRLFAVECTIARADNCEAVSDAMDDMASAVQAAILFNWQVALELRLAAKKNGGAA
jgi:hypothetical protein